MQVAVEDLFKLVVGNARARVAGTLASAVSLGLASWGAPLQLRGVEGPVLVPWTSWPCGVVVVTSWVLAREPRHRARAGMVMAQIFSMIALTLLALTAWAPAPFIRPMPVFLSLQALAVALAFVFAAQQGILYRSVQRPLELAGPAVRQRFFIALGLAGLFAAVSELVGLQASSLFDVLVALCLDLTVHRFADGWLWLAALGLLAISVMTSWRFARSAPFLAVHLRWAPLSLSLATMLGLLPRVLFT